MNKELDKKAGMKENVSLITDGCDNMLSKVGDDDDYQRKTEQKYLLLHHTYFVPESYDKVEMLRFVTWNTSNVGSVSNITIEATSGQSHHECLKIHIIIKICQS